MRRIDLLCKLIGPLVIGLIDSASTKIALGLILGSNILSIAIEYFTIARVSRIDTYRTVKRCTDKCRSITWFQA